jgi:hypothetical protein
MSSKIEKEEKKYSFSGESIDSFSYKYEFNSFGYKNQIIFIKVNGNINDEEVMIHDMLWGTYVDNILIYEFYSTKDWSDYIKNTIADIFKDYIGNNCVVDKKNYLRFDFYPYTLENLRKINSAEKALIEEYGEDRISKQENVIFFNCE